MHPGDDHDPEETARVRRAVVHAARLRIEAVRAAAPAGTFEYAFLRREPETFNDFDLALLARLTWHYRRRLPSYLCPDKNPDDPIVRESARTDG